MFENFFSGIQIVSFIYLFIYFFKLLRDTRAHHYLRIINLSFLTNEMIKIKDGKGC